MKAQLLKDDSFLKRIIDEKNTIHQLIPNNNSFPIRIIYYQNFIMNSNLPNLENLNGVYAPKGYGSITSAQISMRYSNFYISLEPTITDYREFKLNLPEKEKYFSVLNDVPIKNEINRNLNRLKNTGFIFKNNYIKLGYGNWNRWWGPGVHNSLTITNNSQGFYHYFIGTNNFNPLFGKINYNLEYVISNSIQNHIEENFYISIANLKLRYNNLEFGFSRNIMSGGYDEISWDTKKAAQVILTNQNIRYWDHLNNYYISYNNQSSGVFAFFEYGYPGNRSYGDENPSFYSNHASSSILGLRKYKAFNRKNLMFGLEYARLVQGYYYNIIPTPNWYDNIRYNYSSYNNRRWAAHSGTDSDDLFVFFGLLGNKINFIYGINYERHGVTFHFPPEVKFESKAHISFSHSNTNFSIILENEYFEHYGFVDSNINVWTQSFEKGSIQRTHTILFSIEHIILP